MPNVAGSIDEIRVFERRVAQPEAEGKQRLPCQVEIVVASARRLVVVAQRHLTLGHRERDGQTARGIRVAEEHVGDGRATHFARVPDVDDGADVLEPWHRDRAAADEHDHRRLSRRRDGPNHLLLTPGQRERRPVAKLAFLDARDDDRHVAAPSDRDGTVDRRARIVAHTGVPHELHARVARALEVFQANRVRACRRAAPRSRAVVPYDCFRQLSMTRLSPM